MAQGGLQIVKEVPRRPKDVQIRPKIASRWPKRPPRSALLVTGNGHFAGDVLKTWSFTQPRLHIALRRPQDGPAWTNKTTQEGPNMAPIWSLRGPRTVQDGLQDDSREPKRPRDGPRALQAVPRRLKTTQEAPKTPQDASKITPKRARRDKHADEQRTDKG